MRKGGRGRPFQGKGMDRLWHTGRRWLKHRGGQAGSMERGGTVWPEMRVRRQAGWECASLGHFYCLMQSHGEILGEKDAQFDLCVMEIMVTVQMRD